MSRNRGAQRAHRDADEEALQVALRESMQPDYMAQILRSESHSTPPVAPAAAPRSTPAGARAGSHGTLQSLPSLALTGEDDDEEDADMSDAPMNGDGFTDDENEDDEGEEESNRHHKLLNFAEYLLVDLLRYLDEDSVGNCISVCKRLRHVASCDSLFETLCKRIFPAQSPRVAAAAAKNKFTLRKFATWFDMFHERPRVRHNGLYYLKTSYYKKPELSMWSDISPGTILQVVYYRYFSFQRDGSVLYAMLFKPPREAGALLKRRTMKEVWRGSFHVDKSHVTVSVPTNHCVVEFKFRISSEGTRGKNVKLVLQEHYSFSEPDRTGWVTQFDTFDAEFQFYRRWDL